MLNCISVIVLLSISCITYAVISDDLRVSLPDGSKLLGKYLRSHIGRPIKAFTSIPYAKPPLGQLRFKVKISAIK